MTRQSTLVFHVLLAAMSLVTVGCATPLTHIQKNDKEKLRDIKEFVVIFSTSSEVRFGEYRPEFSISAKEFDVPEAVKTSILTNLSQRNRSMKQFLISSSESETRQLVAQNQGAPILLLAENAIQVNNGFNYVGVGFVLRRKNLFQTDIRPYSMFSLYVINLSEGTEPLAQAYNSHFVGGYQGSIVGGVKLAKSANEYNERDRSVLKAALGKRIDYTVSALMFDLGLSSKSPSQ